LDPIQNDLRGKKMTGKHLTTRGCDTGYMERLVRQSFKGAKSRKTQRVREGKIG